MSHIRPLVFVEWEDASGPARAGWHFVTDYGFDKEYLCQSVGWVVAESRTHVHLAPHFGNVTDPDPANEQMTGMIAIPKRMIRKRVKLINPRRKRHG